MPTLDMPAGVLTVRAQDLLPGDVVDVLSADRIITAVDIMPISRMVWVTVADPGSAVLHVRVPLWMDSEVICTRRQVA